jgi:hypothetical protein
MRFRSFTRGVACPSIHRSVDRAHSILTPIGPFTIRITLPTSAYPGHYPGPWLLGRSHSQQHPVDTYSAAITQQPRAGWSYNVPGLCLTLNLGSHYSPGYLKDATGSKLQICPAPNRALEKPRCHSPCRFLDQANNPRWLVIHDDDSNVSLIAYPYPAVLDGVPGRVPSYRLSFPLHGLTVGLYRGESASPQHQRGRELHSYRIKVIKDRLWSKHLIPGQTKEPFHR